MDEPAIACVARLERLVLAVASWLACQRSELPVSAIRLEADRIRRKRKQERQLRRLLDAPALTIKEKR